MQAGRELHRARQATHDDTHDWNSAQRGSITRQ
jgi:hypothetical protein